MWKRKKRKRKRLIISKLSQWRSKGWIYQKNLWFATEKIRRKAQVERWLFMLVEWSTIIRREMEIKANSAKFRMQSNPTDWEQDTLLLSELFSFFSLFFLPFFFSRREQYSSFFLFSIYIYIYIFNTVDIYMDSSPICLFTTTKFRGRLTFFENLSLHPN